VIEQIAPVVRAISVAVPPERAFKVFTERIGAWWPLEMHGVFGDKAKTCVMEPRVGGRVYEVSVDGEEASWAEVTAYEPPERIVWSWRPNRDRPAPTEVEITFTPEGGGTRVELMHRGWELLGDEGAEARDSYDSGWPKTLARFAEIAEEADAAV
jgi:uncharacterized protein YndB with AHSA1/START domain